MEILGKRLKELRLERGLTQAAVAQAIGITNEKYLRFEHGKVKRGIGTIIKLADFYKVSLDYLLRTDF